VFADGASRRTVGFGDLGGLDDVDFGDLGVGGDAADLRGGMKWASFYQGLQTAGQRPMDTDRPPARSGAEQDDHDTILA
jgi:hypothetical protein